MILKLRHVTGGVLAGLMVALISTHALADDDATTIRGLLQKQQAVLRQLVEVQTRAYTQGEVDIEAVVQAHRELLIVELELTDARDERIKLLENAVRLTSRLEDIANAKYKAGQAPQADTLKCQAETLKARTELMRERQKDEKK